MKEGLFFVSFVLFVFCGASHCAAARQLTERPQVAPSSVVERLDPCSSLPLLYFGIAGCLIQRWPLHNHNI
jgi:hypothetical protein